MHARIISEQSEDQNILGPLEEFLGALWDYCIIDPDNFSVVLDLVQECKPTGAVIGEFGILIFAFRIRIAANKYLQFFI